MLKRFLDYVEIRTKITSLYAFIMTIAYLFYLKQEINIKLTIVFFLAMFLIDLATTAINNYIDTKTNHQTLQFDRKTALTIIIIMLVISIILGIYLAVATDLVVLILGGICFLCGVFYTFGPLPISRQPLGEIFSGIFYGFFIPFILLYINMPKGTYIDLQFVDYSINLKINILPILKVILLSVTPVCATANIMLANNICDLEKDIEVKRHTLPYYIGKKSLKLFAMLYYITYIATIAMVVFKVLPPIHLIFLLSIIPVQKNIKYFNEKQEKSTTFIYSIKNFLIIMNVNCLTIFLCGLFR